MKLILSLLLIFPFFSSAQLLNSIELQFTELLNPSFQFNLPSEYNNGIVVPATSSVSVISDQNWVLSVSSGGATHFSTTTGDLMPVGDALVKPTTSGSFTSISTSNQSIMTGLATYYLNGLLQIVSTGNGNSTCLTLDLLLVQVNVSCFTFTLDYKIDLSGFYEAGTYNTTIYYTLSAQ